MSAKLRILRAQTSRLGVKAAMVVGIIGAIFAAVSYYADMVEEDKTSSANAYSERNGRLSTMRTQLSNSGVAQKRFIEIQAVHANDDYSMDRKALSEWLVDAKTRYRLNQPKLTPGTDAPTERPELQNYKYDITVRPQMKVEFQAVSDVHAFSMIQDLIMESPGLFRVMGIELKRKGDLDDNTLRGMRAVGGGMPTLVEVTIDLRWVGVSHSEKKPKDAKAGGK